MKFIFPFLPVMMLLLFSCSSKEEAVIIHADPWIRPFLEPASALYEAEHETELKIIYEPSIRSIWRIKYGEHADVLMLPNEKLISSSKTEGLFQKPAAFGGDALALVTATDVAKADSFVSKRCTIIPPAETGLFLYLDSLNLLPGEQECRLVAHMHELQSAWMQRSWAQAGWFYRSTAVQQKWKTEAEIPLPEGNWKVAVTTDAPHPEEAEIFIEFLRSEKAQRLLEQKGFIPYF